MSQRIRIVVDGEVLINPHFSGIGHYTLELLRALDQKMSSEKSIKIVLLVHFRHIYKVKQFGFKNIKIQPSPFSLRISNALKIRGLQPPLDLFFGKGVYLFPNFTSWPLAFSKSIPVIYDLSYETYAEFAEPRNQIFLSAQVKKAVKRATRILTISENSKSEIASFYNYPISKIDVAYPAVDTKNFYPRSSSEILKTKSRYKIVGNYILFVGNIEPRKNLKNLLLAYEQLPKKLRKKYSLLLVGAKGWRDGEIFTIIKRLRDDGNIIQLPSDYVLDRDLPSLYSGASLFVYPSLYEGFGIPPLEAMACGVPVITSNNSSLPEVCGNAANLVDANSVQSISNEIKSLLINYKQSEKDQEKRFNQVQRFSWEKTGLVLIKSVKKVSE